MYLKIDYQILNGEKFQVWSAVSLLTLFYDYKLLVSFMNFKPINSNKVMINLLYS
jgi:hypothetical protein